MYYLLSCENPHLHLIRIRFTCTHTGDAPLRVQLPAWRPGRYELANFAQNVKSFAVYNSAGQQLSFAKITKDCWEIKTRPSDKKVIIDYTYYANELNAGSSFLDETQLYVNPVNCLLYIPGRETEPCHLHLELPGSYKVATALQSKGKHQFEAISYHELADSPFIASRNLLSEQYTCHGTPFRLWFHGECRPDWKRLLHHFKLFTETHFRLFHHFPFRAYQFLFQILPFPFYHGVEHAASTVIALGPGYDLMQEKYTDLLGISSHELFHAWNVKSIRPAEMMPYDYSRENYSRLGYVTEGATTYYGDVLLLRAGVFSLGNYLTELNQLLSRHFNNPGRLNLSVADSSFDTWLDGYKAGIPGRKSSIYVEGALCAFMLDMRIRSYTRNRRSLDDVMRMLYQRFGKQQIGYTEADFKAAAEEAAAKNLDDFFKKYIWGVHPFNAELKRCLHYLGLQLVVEKNPLFTEGVLGLKTTETAGKVVVSAVYPDSPAERAGVTPQDEIIAMNGMQMEGNAHAWAQYFAASQPLRLLLATNKCIREVQVTPGKHVYYPVYRVVPQKKPTSEARINFKAWSTCP
ncbi:MAG: peptidase M61 [Chitinophagales bacterium]|nr:MAG: peptidase M61 [Chitinophagales bacterium]